MRIRKELNEKDETNREIAKISDALAHPVRAALFRYVRNSVNLRNDVCNSDLVNHFNYSQATISQHVKKLVDAGLFIVTKKDKYSIYKTNEKTMTMYINLLETK